MFENIERGNSALYIQTISKKHQIRTPKTIARTKAELTQLLDSDECVKDSLLDQHDNKLEVKVVRFVLTKNNQLGHVFILKTA